MEQFIYEHYLTGSIPLLYMIQMQEDCPVHSHDYDELVIVLSGTGHHVTESVCYSLQPGDVFVIHKNHSHGYKNIDSMTAATFMFHYDDFFKNNEDFESISKFRTLFRYTSQYQFPYRMFLTPDQFMAVEKLIRRFSEEQTAKKIGFKAMTKTLFMELTVFLIRNYQVEYDTRQKFFPNLAECLNYIEEHYNEELKIKFLAHKAGMSCRNFQREFKRITGKSPTEYLIDKRLAKAIHEMKHSEKNLTEISLTAGFQSSNYFSRIFKTRYGVSPREYRKRQGAT